jgi:hypothetical protein
MGWGGFGSNGSVHWKIVHTADEKQNGFIRGRDPNIAFGQRSSGEANTHFPPAEFVVKLRFAGGAEKARAALRIALDKVYEEHGYGIVEVRVPAIPRETEPPDNALEIVVVWSS